MLLGRESNHETITAVRRTPQYVAATRAKPPNNHISQKNTTAKEN